jgi:hypothetical protein
MSKYVQYSNSLFNRQLLAFDIGDTFLVSYTQFGRGGKQTVKAIMFQHLDDILLIDTVPSCEGKFLNIQKDFLHVEELCHTRTVLTEKFRWRKYFEARSFLKGGYEEYEKLRTQFTKNYAGNNR